MFAVLARTSTNVIDNFDKKSFVKLSFSNEKVACDFNYEALISLNILHSSEN